MMQESEFLWEYGFNGEDSPRPELSLEISNLPQTPPNNKARNHENTLATLLSPRNGKHTHPAMDTACEIVQTILDQVSRNDLPPSNEESGLRKATKSKVPERFSQQCHIQKLDATPSSSNNTQPSPADLWNAHYEKHCNTAEQKMGNVALATLCARTLETVGKLSLPTKEAEASQLRSPVASKTDSRESNRSPKMKFLKRRRKQNPTKDVGKDVVEHEARGETSNVAEPAEEQRDGEEPKLQMFGSEYARYLSTTTFASQGLTSPRGITSKSLSNRKRKNAGVEKLEDASEAILTGAITDIVVTHGNEKPPKGFYRISQSATGEEFYLHDKKAPAYINVKKESNWDRAAQRPCVTAFTLIFPARKEFVPPGYSVVRRHTTIEENKDTESNAANLNYHGEPVFLCFRRSREGNPITGLLPLLPQKGEHIPQGYTVLEKTPRNFLAGISTCSSTVFLAFRQRLSNLEPLRPLPLVISAQNRQNNRNLNAYYCTGGTVVDSRVGRFHIMDRSTHSLLSPKSISNRLSMIEASRQKTLDSLTKLPSDSGNMYQYSGGTPRRRQNARELLASSLLLAPGLGTPGSISMVSDSERLSQSGDHESLGSFFGDSRFSGNGMTLDFSPVHQSPRSDVDDGSQGSLAQSARSIAKNDKDMKRCLGAMSFIPVVSSSTCENSSREIFQFQARVAILTPVLTACYTRHGGSVLLAVEGLLNLLEEDFFAGDVHVARDASSRITLLDVAVQAVCDVATSGAQELHMPMCVEFVAAAVKNGRGHLNTRTIGYVMRFYLFVFYFGVSIAQNEWALLKGRDKFLLLDPHPPTLKNLPGGATQAAALSLKDLILYSISRLRSLVLSDTDAARCNQGFRNENHVIRFNSLIDDLVDGLIDSSVHRVHMANYAQLALHQVKRTGGSEMFWYDMMNICGKGLFSSDEIFKEETRHLFSICFTLLAKCVKVALSPVRKGKNGKGMPRDISSKLMSMEMIDFFLREWNTMKGAVDVPKSRAFETFIFCIRRLVIPCLLLNAKDSMQDPRVFKRIIRIIGTLLNSQVYRAHLKLEIGILLEQFVVNFLSMGPQFLVKKPIGTPHLFAQQLELMTQMRIWFSSSPDLLLELYVNYDSRFSSQTVIGEPKFLSAIDWNLCQGICACSCDVAEKCCEYIGDQIRRSQTMSPSTKDDPVEVIQGMTGRALARESAERLRSSAILLITQIAQSLAKSSAFSRGQGFQKFADSWTVPTDANESETASDTSFAHEPVYGSELESTAPSRGSLENMNIIGYWKKRAMKRKGIVHKIEEATAAARNGVALEGNTQSSHVSSSNDEGLGKSDNLSVACEIAVEKSLRKAIEYLIACSVLTRSPRDIAYFLRIHRGNLKASDLGVFLSEGGSNFEESEHCKMIRYHFIRAISFVGVSVLEGLRLLLTNGGFKLPGEAQQIERMMATFAACYWEDNAGDQAHCPFHDQNSVFVVAFAIIMLNTDLHKSKSAATSCAKQQPRSMSKSEFVNNLSGALPKQDLNVKYLSAIYQSIASRPIAICEDVTTKTPADNLHKHLESFLNNAKSANALLRGFAVHDFKFVCFKAFAQKEYDGAIKSAARDVTRKITMKTWHLFHSFLSAGLDMAYLDPTGLELSVDLVKYMLSLTVCLELPIERRAFLAQLGRLKQLKRAIDSPADLIKTEARIPEDDERCQSLEQSCISSDKGKLESLGQINQLVHDLSTRVKTDSANRDAMKTAVAQLKGGDSLLSDPTRSFIRLGDLVKQANTTGRYVDYRFFLFSDILIYAKRIPKTKLYKVHEGLPLLQMKIVDWFPPETKDGSRTFQVFHPLKKVMVLCEHDDERRSWVASLRTAIENELHRNVAIEAARMAAAYPKS